jgi:hypothetical protein
MVGWALEGWGMKEGKLVVLVDPSNITKGFGERVKVARAQA